MEQSQEWSQERIEELIQIRAEENIHLEFKSKESFDKKTQSKRKEICKDVSAFANSDGGVLIYGIIEENHAASSLSFIDGNEFSKEWIESVINGGIQRKVDDIRIYPIRFDDDVQKTVYVIDIPVSPLAPHMVDNKFYKRYNFESTAMEEYEVRDVYSRRQNIKLELILSSVDQINIGTWSHEERLKIECIFNVLNLGNIVAEDFKLKTEWIKDFYYEVFSESGERFEKMSSLHQEIISKASSLFLYPGEEVVFLKVVLIIPINRIQHIDSIRCNTTLFSSGYKQEKMFELGQKIRRIASRILDI